MPEPLTPTEVRQAESASPKAIRPRRTLRGTSIRAIAVLLVLSLLGVLVWANFDWNRFFAQRKKQVDPSTTVEKSPLVEPNKAAVPPNAAILEAQKSVVL